MTGPPPELLTQEEARAYWDGRHRDQGQLLSGGDLTYDGPANEAFYATRLGLLLRLVGYHSSATAPQFVLDAGCGKGWFARALARCGHQVDGIDASPEAVRQSREAAGGPRYSVSSLAEWRSPWLYDVVYSVDVLFHILDDREWEASVRNLAGLARLHGRIVLSDWTGEGDREFGNYMVARGRQRYEELLADCGFRYEGLQPYGFRANVIGFHSAQRVG